MNMMIQALENFQQEHDVSLEKITGIPLEGEGTIERRVELCVSVTGFFLVVLTVHVGLDYTINCLEIRSGSMIFMLLMQSLLLRIPRAPSYQHTYWTASSAIDTSIHRRATNL